MRQFATALAAMLAAASACGQRSFDLYQPIIDRAPFGPPPEDASVPPELVSKSSGANGAGADDVELSVEQEQLQQSVGVSAINIAPDGRVRVGFSDMGDAKSPKHYYLAVEEERDGWLVKEADPVEKSVVLSKNGIEITRKLGQAAEKGAAKGGAKGGAAAARGKAGPARNSPLLARGGAAESMKSRRQQKQEQAEAERRARQEQAEAAKKRDEEARAQREADRAAMEAEREEMRQNLMNIRDEIRNATEERRRREAEERAEETAQEGGGDAEDNS